MLFMTRTVELEGGHEVTVTLKRSDRWWIDGIDLETDPPHEIEGPPGGPYADENEALDAARKISEAALRDLH